MAVKKQAPDLAQVLIFPFQDEKWLKKVLIASGLILLSIIPVIPIVLLLGYLGEIIKRIAVNGEQPSLPEWDDFSTYFQDGFRLFGAGAIYMIPATLCMIIGYAGMFIPVFAMESGRMSESEAFGILMAGYVIGFGMMGIGVLISMITGFFLPIAGTHAAVKEEFGAAFHLRDIWQILKANWGGFLVAFLILIGGGVVIYYGSYILVVTVILCCLYPFVLCFLTAYLVLIGAALFAGAYRQGVENLPPDDLNSPTT